MEEITIEENPFGKKILICGKPELEAVVPADLNVFIAQMERVISEMYEKNEQRKKYKKG